MRGHGGERTYDELMETTRDRPGQRGAQVMKWSEVHQTLKEGKQVIASIANLIDESLEGAAKVPSPAILETSAVNAAIFIVCELMMDKQNL
jgi:hypothetical protein